MSREYWTSTVSQIGDHTQEMFDAGVYILFGEPVPHALAEISVVHKGTQGEPEVRVGDTLTIGDVVMTIDEVGEIANMNLAELGHSVVYLNSPKQKLLPGAMKAHGDANPHPQVGDHVAFSRGD